MSLSRVQVLRQSKGLILIKKIVTICIRQMKYTVKFLPKLVRKL